MKIFKLKYSQKLPINLNEAWDFLSSPNNLELITPKSMDFNITDWDKKKAYPGQIIQYTVKPFLGLKINWVTEITHVENHHFFADKQLYGPYELWHHKHFFKEIEGGVQIIDIVDYVPPFGILGRIINPVIIKPRILKIFDYRKREVVKMFPSK